MISGFEEIKAKAAGMFVYFSAVMKKEVYDITGERIGSIWDVAVNSAEVYPRFEELIISKGSFKRLYASLPWAKVKSVDDTIILDIKKSELTFSHSIKEYLLLVRRDILDQQVVDTYNHKVRRVNDVHLLRVDNDFMIAHVDIGLRGLIRRLDWEKGVDLFVRVFMKRSKYLTAEELVSWKFVQPTSINPASMTMKLSLSEKQLQSIPAADLVEIIFDLTPNQRIALFRTLDVKTKAKVFENLEFEEQKEMLKELDKKEAAQIVGHMSSDEATDLLERLPNSTVKNLLALIESGMAKKLSTLLGYSSDSAGGLMTTEYISLPELMTSGDALENIKRQARESEVVPYIYLVDEKNRLKGITTLRRILIADPDEIVIKTVFPKMLYVHLHDGMKEVAYMMDKYKMSAIPVIDENKALSGVITVDDVLSQVISIAWRKRPRVPKGL